MSDRCEGAEWNDWGHARPDGEDRLCTPCRRLVVEAAAVDARRTWELFAQQYEDGHLEHFYHGTAAYCVCGPEPIFLVRLTRDPEGPYWGWHYSHHPANGSNRGSVSMIYRNETLVRICFPYGVEVETKRGRGELRRFRVEVLRPAVGRESIP